MLKTAYFVNADVRMILLRHTEITIRRTWQPVQNSGTNTSDSTMS